jgi:hypothetical protein
MQTQPLVAAYLREHGFPWATDAGSGRPGTDILNTPGLGWEIKARAQFDPLAWLRQARGYPGLPLVVWRPNGYGPSNIAAWPMMTLFGPGVELLRAAGYGDPLSEVKK